MKEGELWFEEWLECRPAHSGPQWPSQAITVAVSVPLLLQPSLGPRWLPESSRWLLLHGKTQAALRNLRKVAAMNGREEEGERLTKEVGRSGASSGSTSFQSCWQPRDVLGFGDLPGLTIQVNRLRINRVGRAPVRQRCLTIEWLCDLG